MKYLGLLLLGLCQVKAQDYNCTTAGRFRYEDSTCRSYYLCVLYNGNYVKSNYTCPSNMIFNPTAQVCSTDADCIDDICNGLPAIPALPKIPDPNGPDCVTYIQCVGVGVGQRYPVLGTCPSGLLFNDRLNPPDCSLTGNC